MSRVTQIPITVFFDDGAPPCCCGQQHPTDCYDLPDELALELSVCGRTWIETLVKVENGIWETECDSQYSVECDGQPCSGGAIQNQLRCFQLKCWAADDIRLSTGVSCSGGRCNTSSGMLDLEPDSFTQDPFELVYHTGLPTSANACCDDPPCYEVPTITVRIP